MFTPQADSIRNGAMRCAHCKYPYCNMLGIVFAHHQLPSYTVYLVYCRKLNAVAWSCGRRESDTAVRLDIAFSCAALWSRWVHARVGEWGAYALPCLA
jgi:hypothetical protein